MKSIKFPPLPNLDNIKEKTAPSPKKQGDEEFDDYDNRMRDFEEKIKLWRSQLEEESKMFREEIDFKFE